MDTTHLSKVLVKDIGTFDLMRYRRLKQAHAIASKDNDEVFYFERVKMHTEYVKYLLEYLSTKFTPNDNTTETLHS